MNTRRFVVVLALLALLIGPAVPGHAEEKHSLVVTALNGTTISGYVDASVQTGGLPATRADLKGWWRRVLSWLFARWRLQTTHQTSS